jgi:cleavage and polyadenylation specificity factor subunit 1
MILFFFFFFSFFFDLQKTFSFAVRDSLTNVGPLKDFSYGLRMNADANATGIAKQSNYELVSFVT